MAAVACLVSAQASAQVSRSSDGQFTRYRVQQSGQIDYANAKAMPLPFASSAPSAHDGLRAALDAKTIFNKPGHIPGSEGNGKQSPVRLAPALDDNSISPQEYGTSNQVFTTARVNVQGDQTSKFYPNRAAGKLFFKENGASFVCSASLVQPGLVVTAAHCVANYGQSQFYSDWQFAPAYNNGGAPYGTWTAFDVWIKTAYYNGTDNCYQFGVICPDDVAIIVLNPKQGVYAGTNVGWYGVGWNGFGFNGSNLALINQLGYPVALDGGKFMLRNDSQGFVNSTFSNNTIIGSLLTGGSSGGPWLVNLGIQPALGCDSNGCTQHGSESNANTVVGVTSWGYNPSGSPAKYKVMQQGAAPFTTNNVCSLMKSGCTIKPAACAITAASLPC